MPFQNIWLPPNSSDNEESRYCYPFNFMKEEMGMEVKFHLTSCLEVLQCWDILVSTAFVHSVCSHGYFPFTVARVFLSVGNMERTNTQHKTTD